MASLRQRECERHGKKRKHVRFCRVDGGCLWFYCFLMLACSLLCLTKLVIGFLYVNACPAQPMVPVYLIVSGIIPLFLFLTCRLVESNKPGKYMILCYDRREWIIVLVVGLVFTCWLSVGTYFIAVTKQEVGACTHTDLNTTSVNTTLEYTSPTIQSLGVSSNTTTHYTNTIGATYTTLIADKTINGSIFTTESTNATSLANERKCLVICSDFILTFSYAIMIFEWCVIVISILSYPIFYLMMMLVMVLYYYVYEDDQ